MCVQYYWILQLLRLLIQSTTANCFHVLVGGEGQSKRLSISQQYSHRLECCLQCSQELLSIFFFPMNGVKCVWLFRSPNRLGVLLIEQCAQWCSHRFSSSSSSSIFQVAMLSFFWYSNCSNASAAEQKCFQSRLSVWGGRPAFQVYLLSIDRMHGTHTPLCTLI